MKKNSRDLSKEIKEFEDFFEKKPDAGEKAWGLIHDFYNDILSYMENEKIKKTDLADKLKISRAAVSKIFNENPNISVKRMVEIADAVGMDVKIECEPVKKDELDFVELFGDTFEDNQIDKPQEIEKMPLREGISNQIIFNTPIHKNYKK